MRNRLETLSRRRDLRVDDTVENQVPVIKRVF